MKLLLLAAAALLALPAASQTLPQPDGLFDRADTDRSGSISRAEWEAAGRKPPGFDRLDSNRDGQLSRAELAAGLAAMRAARAAGGRDGGASAFARADSNGDGRVTRAEWRALADRRFAAMDGDGDGVLTAAEMERPRGRAPLR